MLKGRGWGGWEKEEQAGSTEMIEFQKNNRKTTMYACVFVLFYAAFVSLLPLFGLTCCKRCSGCSPSGGLIQGLRAGGRGGGEWLQQHMCESFNCGWPCLVLLAQHFLNQVQKSFQSAVILHPTQIFSIMGGGEKKEFKIRMT